MGNAHGCLTAGVWIMVKAWPLRYAGRGSRRCAGNGYFGRAKGNWFLPESQLGAFGLQIGAFGVHLAG